MLPVFTRWPAKHPQRIQLFSMNTPNGVKASIALEELGLPYEAHTIDIRNGDQHCQEYLALNPNGKIPVIIDPNGPGGEAISIMESGAILIYLADKAGKLIPTEPMARNQCLQWLFFQVGHIGPMFGQFGHFYKYAVDACRDPYPIERYTNESRRLLGILDARLTGNAHILGDDYSIADIAIFPWVNCLSAYYEAEEQLGLKEFPHVNAWVQRCLQRPAVKAGMQVCAPE
jgi:GST-like protein